MAAESYIAFLASSAVLVLLPGPGQALTIATASQAGFRAGALTVVGLNIGTILHALAAGLGLTTLFSTSSTAYSTVRIAGAAYLVYLGVSLARAAPSDLSPGQATTAANRSPLSRGFVAGTLNPKVAVFFLAYLPQFVEPARGWLPLQFLLLGLGLAVMDTLYGLFLAAAAGRASTNRRPSPRVRRLQAQVSGGVLVLCGAWLALGPS